MTEFLNFNYIDANGVTTDAQVNAVYNITKNYMNLTVAYPEKYIIRKDFLQKVQNFCKKYSHTYRGIHQAGIVLVNLGYECGYPWIDLDLLNSLITADPDLFYHGKSITDEDGNKFPPIPIWYYDRFVER